MSSAPTTITTNLTNMQVSEWKHVFGITSSQLNELNWHVSKTSGTLSWTVSAYRQKPQTWPFQPLMKTQFRNFFLFPFLYSKERMWLVLMRREVEREGDIRLQYRKSKCTTSGLRDHEVTFKNMNGKCLLRLSVKRCTCKVTILFIDREKSNIVWKKISILPLAVPPIPNQKFYWRLMLIFNSKDSFQWSKFLHTLY